MSTINGEVLLVDLAACTTSVVSSSFLVFYDIAVCPGSPNIIYGIENSGMNSTLYTINATTGVTTLISNQFANQFGGYPNHLLNSLVCDGNGNLYAADYVTSTLYKYDIAAGTWSVVGNLGGQTSSGDLTFFNGELYLSTSSNQLLHISLNPFSTNVVSNIGVPAYGVQTVFDPNAICASDGYTMIASANNDLYYIDPQTGSATLVCQDIISSNDLIAGGASLDESLTSSTNTLTGVNPPSICPGDSATITVANSGVGNYTYVWAPSGGTNLSAQVSPATTTTYTITSTDANGCTQTKSVTVTVKPIPNVTATSNTLCNGESGQIVASGASTYSWNTGQTTPSIIVSPASTTTYTVTGTHANGCTKTVTTQVNILPSPSIQLDSTAATCGSNNGTATVTASGAGATYYYSWSGGGGTSATASNLAPGTYSIFVSSANGCTSTGSVTIITQGVLSLNPTLPDTICPNQNTTISVNPTGTPPYSYSWNTGDTLSSLMVSPDSTTNYSVFVSDATGCVNTQNFQVVVEVNPLSLDVSPDSSICPGEIISLFASAGGGNGTMSYSWSPSNLSQQGISISPLVSTVYTVVVTDQCGVTAQQTINVNVDPSPHVLFSGQMPPSCTTICVNFLDQSSVSNGVVNNWSWDFGDGTNSTLQNPSHCYANSGNYSVSLSVVSDAGCVHDTTLLQSVSISGGPTADFSFSPLQVDIDEPLVTFNNLSVGDSLSYQWYFGDANDTTVSSIKDPSHIYSQTGSYCITLIAKDTLSCSDTVVKCLEVKPNWSIYFPNSFTPNGDGKNDFFVGYGTGIISYEMWVFDRWGNQIFNCSATVDPQTAVNCWWDGKVQNGPSGKLAQIDTYVWLVELRDIFQSPHRVVGHVNLMK